MYLSPFGFSIFWGRVGGILLISATYGLAASIIKRLFSCNTWLIYISCLVSLLAFPYWSLDFMIHYYNFPFFLLVLFFFSFLVALERDGLEAKLFIFLTGVIALAIPFARVSLCWIPAVPLVYLMLPPIHEWRTHNKALFFYIAGCIVSGSLFYFAYTVWSRQYVFFPGIPVTLMERIRDFKHYFLIMIPVIFQSCGCVVLIVYLRCVKKIPLLVKSFLLLVFIAILGSFMYYYANKYSGGTGFGITVYWVDIIVHAPFILMFYQIFTQSKSHAELPVSPKIAVPAFNLFILMLCSTACLYPFGTNLGLIKISYTLPLIGPLLILILILNSGWSKDLIRTVLFFLCLSGMGMILFMSVFDVPRYRCSTSFDIECAKGILTSPRRADYADSVVSELKKITKKNEEVMCILVLKYMFFTMSERRAWNHEEWQFRHDKLFDRFEWTWKRKKLPRVAIVDENALTPYRTWGKEILSRFYDKKYSYNFANSEFIVLPQPKKDLVISIWTRNDHPETESEKEALLRSIREKYAYK